MEKHQRFPFQPHFSKQDRIVKENYQQLIAEYQLNDMLYQAKISFEPVIGEVYHLYVRANQDEKFLCLIPPNSWNKEYVGSFQLNHEKTWKQVEV